MTNALVPVRTPDAVLAAVVSVDSLIEPQRAELVADKKEAIVRKKIAGELRILTEDALNQVGDQLRSTLKHVDDLEARRVAFVKPLNDLVKKVNGLFNGAKKEWEQVAELAEHAVLQYRASRHAASQAAAMTAQHMSATQSVVGTSSTAQQYQGLVAHAAAPQALPQGISAVEDWGWEVFDPSKVPDVFKMIDEKKVNQTVAFYKGSTVIPGVRVFRKDHLSVRRAP